MAKITGKEFWDMLKLLRIDVFFFVSTLSLLLPNIALNQLIQDKYCINIFKVNETICLNLESLGSDYDSIKNQVLTETTTLKMYITLLVTIPTVFLSLVLGYWIDAYPDHLRYLLSIASASYICQNLMVIYQSIYFEMDPYSLLSTYLVPVITASGTVITIGTFTYATRKTPAKYRAIRFTVLEIFFFATMPVANALGGSLIKSDLWFYSQYRNYVGVNIVSSLCAAFGAIWILILLNDAGEDQLNELETVEVGKEEKNEEKEKTLKQIINDVIKLDNILSASRCVFKKRPNNGHWYLISTIMAGFIASMSYLGEQNISYQFYQRVYHWNAEQIGYYGSIIALFLALGALVGPPLFIHKMQLHDSTVSIIGITSMIYIFLLKGLILSPIVFYFIFLGSFAGVLIVLDRSIISRMIQANEIGKIYAFMTALGGIVPIFSSLYYIKVFQATIHSKPGLVYSLAALMFVYPLINAIILALNKRKWDLTLIDEKQADKDKQNELTSKLLVGQNQS